MVPRITPEPPAGAAGGRGRAGLLLAVMLGTLAGCAGGPPPAPDTEPPAARGWTEEGEASWYGKPYHGRTTASGERYDMRKLTAAHRTLSFGTLVEVTRLDNTRKVVVRITDRGPFTKGRIIDLSRAAAKELDMVQVGLARVRIRVLRPSS